MSVYTAPKEFLSCAVLSKNTDLIARICEMLVDFKVYSEVIVFSSVSDIISNGETNKNQHIIICADQNIDLSQISFVPQPSRIIIISSKINDAIVAFDLGVKDFILEPIDKPRFFKAIRKILDLETDFKSDLILIKSGRKLNVISVKDVIYVQAFGNYIKIFTLEKMFMSLEKLSSFKLRTSPIYVIQCHKSFLVNPQKVKSLNTDSFHLYNDMIIPIGQTYKNTIFSSFSNGYDKVFSTS